VAEDHAAHPVPGERGRTPRTYSGEPPGRHAAVLDELHALEPRVEPGEDRARRVAQLPERVLRRRVHGERDAGRTCGGEGVA
jgi:hypothetical protein